MDHNNEIPKKQQQEKYEYVHAVRSRIRGYGGNNQQLRENGEKIFEKLQDKKLSEIEGKNILAKFELQKQKFKSGISKLYSKTRQPSLVLLEHLDELILGGGEALERDENGKATKMKVSPELQELRSKAGKLYAEVMDISKSINRGYKDKIKGNPLFTEMSQKIRKELIEPLVDHYNENDGKTATPKEEAFFKLAILENNVVAGDKTHER